MADPADPASLRRWLGSALTLLGFRDEEPWPGRRTIPRRPVPITSWTGGTYYRLRKPSGARGERGGHADARERMDAATRREFLPGVSVRAHRRAVRAVLHLQQRTEVLAAERDREASVAFGKARSSNRMALDHPALRGNSRPVDELKDRTEVIYSSPGTEMPSRHDRTHRHRP